MNTYYKTLSIWIIVFSIFVSGCSGLQIKEQAQATEKTSIQNAPGKSTTINIEGLARELPVILFSEGNTRLSIKARKQIREIADLINHPDIINQTITIDGHSDTLGDAHHNMILSRKRADSVSRELVINGVRHSRLIIHALGESQPLVSEFTDDGQLDPQASSLNRRVEIFLGEMDPAEDQL